MIPKKIHYCWLSGDPLPPKLAYCIKSWQKKNIGYEFVKWDLNKFPLDSCCWVKEAFENKKYAFAADYIRLYAVYSEGGIYLDSDVESLRSFDDLLKYPYFLGQEDTPNIIEASTFGAVPHLEWVRKCLDYYNNRHFVKEDGSFDMKPLPEIMRDIFQANYGIEYISKPSDYDSSDNRIQLLPVDFFSPKNWQSLELHKTKNTYSIHHFAGSWLPPIPRMTLLKRKIKAKIKSSLSKKNIDRIRVAKRKFTCLFSLMGEKICRLFFRSSRVNPKYIFFESEGDFCDNARALYEYMLNNRIDSYTFVWKVKDLGFFQKRQFPKNVLLISTSCGWRKSLYAWKILGRCKIFFFTHPYWFSNWKKNQTVVNLCHGSPIKGAGFDTSNKYNYLISYSSFFVDLLARFHHAKKEQVLVFGAPRNDLLFEKKESLEKIYGLRPVNEKFILCMNTFKQGLEWTDSKQICPFVIPDISSKLEIEQLNDFLKSKNILLVVKIHHLQRTDVLVQTQLSNIKYLEDSELQEKDVQLYHLLGRADALLTDYSSVFCDYLLLNRPIGFFLNDYSSYLDGRGFIMNNPLDYMPGFKIYNRQDLNLFLQNISSNEDLFRCERERINLLFNEENRGNNSKRIVDHFILGKKEFS